MSVVDLPKKLEFLRHPARYKVAHGGRGGSKSWGFARHLLIRGAQKRIRVGCFRELQNSIEDSVHKLLKEQIEALGLQGHYEVQKNAIRGRNGTEFLFAGLRSNITKIKSMEGIDIAWVEEAETVSHDSWNVLIPTIRKAGSEIWISFNPREEQDPTYQRFVVNPPPGAVVVKILWSDNRWFPEELKKEKDHLYAVDPEAADHVWGGGTREISDAQILRGRYSVEWFEPQPHWHGPYYGVDWGFAVDPSVMVKLWVEDLPTQEGDPEDLKRRNLYVEREAYGVGVEIDHTPALFDKCESGRDHISRADNARPETISHMKRHGYPHMQAVEKYPGSVEDGIEHLRSYQKIIIHKRCVHAAEEARLWSWKVDKLTGEVKTPGEQVDKHNHIWDAARYALEPVIMARSHDYGYTPIKRPPDRGAPIKRLKGSIL